MLVTTLRAVIVSMALLSIGCAALEDANSAKLNVSNVVPSAAATEVDTSTSISATFSESLKENTVQNSNFYLVEGTDCANTTVAASQITQSGNTYSFSPTVALNAGQRYTTCIKAGVQSTAGNALNSQYSATWTTTNTPAVPGAPSVPGMGK